MYNGRMQNESTKDRSKRILKMLNGKYPGKKVYDLDGRGLHFVAEVEPVDEHPEYDKAVEVIIESIPHKHLKMKQSYTVIEGNLEFHVGESVTFYHAGDKFTVEPRNVHWAKSKNECLVEIYSTPGWTKEDHIRVD